MDPNQNNPRNRNRNQRPVNPNLYPNQSNNVYRPQPPSQQYTQQPIYTFGGDYGGDYGGDFGGDFGGHDFGDYGYSQQGFSEFQIFGNTQEEAVPETQPEPPRARQRKHTKKQREATGSASGSQQPTGRSKTPWTPDELFALAEAWVYASENPIVGNSQKTAEFWKCIRGKFFSTMGRGEYRTYDMISSKWADMNKKVLKFNGIYQQKRQTRRSGQSDQMITDEAREWYQIDQGSEFCYNRSWDLLRKSPKWIEIYVVGGAPSSKSRKTSESSNPGSASASDARFDFNINESNDEDEEPARPTGRDRAKAERAKERAKGKRPSSSNPQPEQVVNPIDNLCAKLEDFTNTRKERQRLEEMKFLFSNTDHLTGIDKEIADLEKQRLRDKYLRKD